MAESFEPDFALADVRVPIHPGAKVGFRIVEMKGDNLFQADERFDLRDSFVPAFRRANVVARRIKVSGIKANAQALRLGNTIINRRQVLNLVAEARSLASRIFQGNSDRRQVCGSEDFVQPRHRLFNPYLISSAKVGSRMHDQKRQPKVGSKSDFLD